MTGLGPAAVGSAPNAAIFFCTYDTVKRVAVQQLGYQVIFSEAEEFFVLILTPGLSPSAHGGGQPRRGHSLSGQGPCGDCQAAEAGEAESLSPYSLLSSVMLRPER